MASRVVWLCALVKWVCYGRYLDFSTFSFGWQHQPLYICYQIIALLFETSHTTGFNGCTCCFLFPFLFRTFLLWNSCPFGIQNSVKHQGKLPRLTDSTHSVSTYTWNKSWAIASCLVQEQLKWWRRLYFNELVCLAGSLFSFFQPVLLPFVSSTTNKCRSYFIIPVEQNKSRSTSVYSRI